MGFTFGKGKIIKLEIFGGKDDGTDLGDAVRAARSEISEALCYHPGAKRGHYVDAALLATVHTIACPECGAWASSLLGEPSLTPWLRSADK